MIASYLYTMTLVNDRKSKTPTLPSVINPEKSQRDGSPRARVVRHVRGLLERGKLAAGDLLPSERSIARDLDVDPRTVGSAMALLEEQGLIGPASSRGRKVNSRQSSAGGLLAQTICIFTTDPAAKSSHKESGWSDQVILGITHAIRANGLHAMFVQSDLADSSALEQVISSRALGTLIAEYAPRYAGPIALKLKEAGIPVVAYGKGTEYDQIDHVVSDHFNGSYRLTRYLLASGCRKPLLIWPEDHDGYWFHDRQAGFEAAMREAGLTPLPPLIVDWGTPLGGYDPTIVDFVRYEREARICVAALAEHITGPDACDALMPSSDGNICVLAAACDLLHVKPGSDVVLAGYDNYWSGMFEQRWRPTVPAATIDKRNREIGQELVSLLLDRIQGNISDQSPQVRVVPSDLIISSEEFSFSHLRVGLREKL